MKKSLIERKLEESGQKAELEELIAAHLASIQEPAEVETHKVEPLDPAKAPKPKVSFAPKAKYKLLGERIAQRKGSTSTDSVVEFVSDRIY